MMIFEALGNPDISPLFRVPPLLGVDSAWWEHIPFTSLMIEQVKPNTVVELGTHNGVSFITFCDALQRANIPGRCYAVDAWIGDHQAGFYGEEVYASLHKLINTRYAHCAELIRSTFDDALSFFTDGSIDLLHIDGLHTYEAVKNDFENWKCKLSDRGIILFHDTNVRQGDFGVYRLWEEIKGTYPSFEFLHGHGLGILAIGGHQDPFVQSLCSLGESSIQLLRERVASIGARWTSVSQELSLIKKLDQLTHTNSILLDKGSELDRANIALAAQGAELRCVQINLADQSSELDRITVAFAEQGAELKRAHIALADQSSELDRVNIAFNEQRDELHNAISSLENNQRLISEAYASNDDKNQIIFKIQKELSQAEQELLIAKHAVIRLEKLAAEYDRNLIKALRYNYPRRLRQAFRRLFPKIN